MNQYVLVLYNVIFCRSQVDRLEISVTRKDLYLKVLMSILIVSGLSLLAVIVSLILSVVLFKKKLTEYSGNPDQASNGRYKVFWVYNTEFQSVSHSRFSYVNV